MNVLTPRAMGELRREARKRGKRHSAMGVDFFVFSPPAFPDDFPPYLVGRWRWDNALLARLLLDPDVPTVDASRAITAVRGPDTC
jgi:hypothetical protein